MTAEGRVSRSSYADAATALAGRVLGALHGSSTAGIADFLDSCADVVAGLGAVRLVGADLFAPHLLPDRPLDARDAGVVADAFGAFPPVRRPATHEQHVMAWRDWATARLLSSLVGENLPEPGSAEAWRDWATTRLVAVHAATPPGEAVDVLGPADDWSRWAVAVAQLSSLALPGAGGPVVEAVAREPLALSRGATRAVLRRDYPTAARLARWVALLADDVPLDPAPLLEHLRLHAAGEPRLLLDLAIADLLLDRGRP
ncbi:hypothetical protein [Saccharothrix sp. Mg75]|uniref:hypothetical protein n=1 Tax=Saccharothrix sp. Mg75 TaxID=3445357 RepID=UPI003EEA405C